MPRRTQVVRSGFPNARRAPRIIYNDDSTPLRNAPPPHTLETLGRVVDYLADTQVDCLCWCVWEPTAIAWPAESNGDVSPTPYGGPNWRIDRCAIYTLRRRGVDYLPLLIERAHARKLMFVASVRMNDTHIKSHPDNVLAPEFWLAHQQYRLWGATDGKSYVNSVLDYTYAPVRRYYREAMTELAGKYDVDGIEMDFTRTPYFFDPAQAWRKRAILTRFVRDVRDRLEQIAAKRKRPLTLILRIPCMERALTEAGIDARQWISRRLAPIVVISGLHNDYNQVIDAWRRRCRDAGVLLYPAVESTPAFNVTDYHTPFIRNPLAPRHDGSGGAFFTDDEKSRLQRAAAQNLLAQQPDGLYMFNFPCWLAQDKNMMYTDPAAFGRATSLLREMGSLKTLAGKDKRYTFYKDLPIYVEAARPRRCHQTITFTLRGKDIRTSQVTLRYRQIAERNPHAGGNYRQDPIVKPGVLKVYLNDREIAERDLKKTRAPAGRIPSAFRIGRHEIVELRVSGRKLRDGGNTLAFEMPKRPAERDPYVYIYDLNVDVTFLSSKPRTRRT